MPKTIIEKLHDLAAIVAEEDKIGSHTTGELFANAAVEAIMAGALQTDGKPTPQWKSYMQNFAETQAQLDRLTLQDSKKDVASVRRSCAYIVSNAVCGAISTTKTFENVASGIEP